MRKDDPQINLRVPPELKARIQEAAKQNRRTQTAEILARLQESFDAHQKRQIEMDEETEDYLLEKLLAKLVERRVLERTGSEDDKSGE